MSNRTLNDQELIVVSQQFIKNLVRNKEEFDEMIVWSKLWGYGVAQDRFKKHVEQIQAGLPGVRLTVLEYAEGGHVRVQYERSQALADAVFKT